MKKNLIKFMSLFMIVIAAFILSGCKKEFEPTRKVSVIMPSGTPVLALGGLLNEENDFEVVTDTTLLQTALTTNDVDVVICPLTMGTNLFLKGKSTYKLEAIVTTNNAYLISNESLEYSNLNGKTIVGFNENNTPGIMLKMFIEQNAISAELQFEQNVNASVSAFTTGNAAYAVVAEPQLTKLKQANPNLNVINLGDKVSSTFVPQAAIFVNSRTRDDINVIHFLKKVEENIKFMNEKPSEYIESVFDNHPYFKTMGSEVLIKSIPTTSVDYLKASSHKASINEFYKNIDKYANNMFGGKTPDDSFYN